MTKKLISRFINVLLLFFLVSCQPPNTQYYKLAGLAQGTTYHITYLDPKGRDFKSEIESQLENFNKSLSIYDSASIVSKINRNEPGVKPDRHFIKVYNKSLEVNKNSAGLFDVTVAPLVNAWGFGFTERRDVDSALIDSLLEFVGMEKVKLNGSELVKENRGIMFDFNAIAQGYSVDLVAEYLDSLKIDNYLVEIGGEIRAKGKNPKNDTWKIGIDKPNENNNVPGEALQNIIEIDNSSLATSGNYRKFFEKEGQKFTHFINPNTGYPVYSNLLSVTVIANDCMTADAYATSLMIMGLEKSKEFLSKNRDIEAYMIYSDEKGDFKTYSTEGMEKRIVE